MYVNDGLFIDTYNRRGRGNWSLEELNFFKVL